MDIYLYRRTNTCFSGQCEGRKVGKLTHETDDHKILREKSIQRLADIRQSAEYIPPDELYPNIPSPDYDESDDDGDDNDSVSKSNGIKNSRNARQSEDEVIEDICPAIPEPVPDYQDEDILDAAVMRRAHEDVTIIKIGGYDRNSGSTSSEPDENRMTSEQRVRLGSDSDGQGLILPKKLPHPCLESKERMALHRELLMNNKLGKDVLKKSELQKKLIAREDGRRKKEQEEYKNSKRTSLEMKLDERANRLKQEEEKSMKPISEEASTTSELSRIYAKITAHKAGDH